MVIGTAGNVQSVQIAENTTGQQQLVLCMRAAMMSMTGFPPSQAPTTARVTMLISRS